MAYTVAHLASTKKTVPWPGFHCLGLSTEVLDERNNMAMKFVNNSPLAPRVERALMGYLSSKQSARVEKRSSGELNSSRAEPQKRMRKGV